MYDGTKFSPWKEHGVAWFFIKMSSVITLTTATAVVSIV
jgi:hypothetical protein